MCLTHPGEEDLGDASTVDRPVVEHHLKPRIKDALREALATAAPSLHALVSPAVSAADAAAGHVEESELARDCGDSDEASLSWCLLSAKFLIDQQLGVHLLNFNGVPQISFPDCMVTVCTLCAPHFFHLCSQFCSQFRSRPSKTTEL